MVEIEKIDFAFCGDSAQEDFSRLEGILDSGHWSDHGLDPSEDTTGLLMRLLQHNGVVVFKKDCPRKALTDYPDEMRRRAREYASILRKRDDGLSLLPLLELFEEQEPDYKRTIHGALFFAQNNAYVRTGGLSPERLLELLASDDCLRVVVIPPYDESALYIFARNMPRESLLEMLANMYEKRTESLREAICKRAENEWLDETTKFE